MTKPTNPVMGGLKSVLSERWREIGLISALLFNLFAMLSLMGFRAEDPTWLHPNTGRVENPCGPLGALLADGLFQTFGYGAWAAFALMVVCVLALAGRSVLTPLRAMMSGGAFVAVLGLAHLVLRPGTAFPPGGVLGRGAAEGLEAGVGTVGSGLVLLGMLIVAVTLLGNIRWGGLARASVERLEAHMPAAREALAGGAAGVGVRLRAAGAALLGMAAQSSRSGVSGLWGMARRVLSTLRNRSGDEEYWDEDSALEAMDGDPDLFSPSESIATAHSLPVAVAEVQWDPTVPGDTSQIREMFTDHSPRNVQDRSEVSSAGGSAVQPAPLLDGGTQPGQIVVERTVASEPSVAGVPEGQVGPKSFGVTLTPPSVEREFEPEVQTPAPPKQRQLGVEVADALQVSDDGGALERRQGWSSFELPKLSLLDIVPEQKAHFDGDKLRELAQRVEETLASFKVTGQCVNVRVGPVVTIFEYLPDAGIKVSRIAGLADDLAMSLCAMSVRIVAPIPGKGVVGIEIPSPKRLNIYFRELLASDTFRSTKFDLPVALGKDVEGKPIIANLVKMPHLLVAGTTGAGKSVGVNGMLMSLLYTCPPEDLRLLLIDPKQLEFKMYDAVPHLLHPVITDPKKAASALDWAVREMEDRYSMLAAWNTRNIVSFNEKVEREAKNWTREKAMKFAPKGWDVSKPLPGPEKMPFIVIVIDELADLMMVAKKEIELSIARLAQKARACGIHLILATQRPSADVVTGLIKSNMPTRIAFKLKSALDSRVILDENGAEKLLGRGDMLHSPNGGEVERVHGAFVSDEEVERVCDYLRSQVSPDYIEDVTAEPAEAEGIDEADRDVLFKDAVEIVIGAGKASTSMVQRHLKIGYNRAARIIDQMEAAGIVGPADGARPREVLVSENVR